MAAAPHTRARGSLETTERTSPKGVVWPSLTIVTHFFTRQTSVPLRATSPQPSPTTNQQDESPAEFKAFAPALRDDLVPLLLQMRGEPGQLDVALQAMLLQLRNDVHHLTCVLRVTSLTNIELLRHVIQ